MQHAARLQVSCGPSFCLAVTAANVWSWGAGEGCVLGHGDTLTRETPVQIEAFKGSVVLQVMVAEERDAHGGRILLHIEAPRPITMHRRFDGALQFQSLKSNVQAWVSLHFLGHP